MKLTVNSKETEVKDGCTVAELSTFLTLPEKGIAIAVNNRMVPRIEWEKCVLHPNDSLVVIKAACGGEDRGTSIHHSLHRHIFLL